jgi:hypothetical protein
MFSGLCLKADVLRAARQWSWEVINGGLDLGSAR